jgi:hypothetical protein
VFPFPNDSIETCADSAFWVDFFFKLVSKQLVGMLLLVIVKKSITSCFRDIKTTAAAAGIMGLMVICDVWDNFR